MDEAARLRELKMFLRSRRAVLRPEDVGLTPNGRRRAVGLRREELAWLAGVSVSWYTWLEQGRSIRFSAPALRRIARALRLSPHDEAYFLALSGIADAKPAASVTVGEHVQAALDAVKTAPALIWDKVLDVVAYNRLADEVFEFEAFDGPFALSQWWRVFRDPVRRALYGDDWEEVARRTAGVVRSQYAALVGIPRFKSIFDDLMANSPDFARLWQAGHTAPLDQVPVRFRHRRHGEFQIEVVRFRLLPEAEAVLSILVPADARACALFDRLARLPPSPRPPDLPPGVEAASTQG